MGGEVDQNRCKQLQMDLQNAKRTKKPLVSKSHWKTRGFNRFVDDVLTKKETVFRLSLWWARRDLNPHVRSEH